MAEETFYTIGELAERAGVTPRTIRYYTAEGLLPRPEARGQYALYGDDHLIRLRLIARLKAAYLPLGEIRARIEQLDADQIRALLAEYGDAPDPVPPDTAADYIAQVLHRQPPQTLAEPRAGYGAAPPAGASSFQPPMAMLRADTEEPAESAPPSPRQPAPPAAPTYGFAAPAPAPSEPASPAPAPGGLLRRLIAQRRDQGAPASEAAESPAAEERWRRVRLAPGVELHIREPLAVDLRERVDRMVAFARDLFR